MDKKILVLNPGNASTKIGLFINNLSQINHTIYHPYDEIKDFKRVQEHKLYRIARIKEFLSANSIECSSLSAIVAIGGLLKPLQSGTYLINDALLIDLQEAKRGYHASNLGGIIGHELALSYGIAAFVVDPVSVDEWHTLARYSGFKELDRENLSHALNTKAIARRWAKENNTTYPEKNLIIIHCGSGITVSAHTGGKMIDSTNSMEEGSFSVERCGSVPSMKLAKLCFSGKFTFNQVKLMLFGEGGIYSYLGVKDFRQAMARASDNDHSAREVIDAMIYQIAKDAGAMATVLLGEVDAIIITGGMAHEKHLVDSLSDRLSFIAPIYRYPGEDEMQALAEGALRVLTGEEQALNY